MPSTNLAPSGTMSGVESGARLTRPRSPNFEGSFVRSSTSRNRCRWVNLGGATSERSATSASMVVGFGPGRAMGLLFNVASGALLPPKHALKQCGGLDQLAGAREACGFSNYLLVQHGFHLVLSARAALTAGVACKAPSTLTEAMVARASSGVTSWAIVASPRTLMCRTSPARRTDSRFSRL